MMVMDPVDLLDKNIIELKNLVIQLESVYNEWQKSENDQRIMSEINLLFKQIEWEIRDVRVFLRNIIEQCVVKDKYVIKDYLKTIDEIEQREKSVHRKVFLHHNTEALEETQNQGLDSESASNMSLCDTDESTISLDFNLYRKLMNDSNKRRKVFRKYLIVFPLLILWIGGAAYITTYALI